MGIVDVSKGTRYLEEHGIPVYAFPEDAVRSMAAMTQFGTLLSLKKRQVRTLAVNRSSAAEIIKEKLAAAEKCYLPEIEANRILDCYGFPVLKSFLITDISQVDEATHEIGFPVAMKIHSPDIVHKFDAGGVKLKIKTIEQARDAYEKIINNAKAFMPDAQIKGVIMEKMAKKGVEVIIGAVRDPEFGPMCMFGLGGTFVEAMKDITFRLSPMWEVSAEIMITTIKAYTILKGVRGAPPSDVDAIKDCILRLSQLMYEQPEVAELDINPLIVYPEGEGCVVADSRMLLRGLA